VAGRHRWHLGFAILAAGLLGAACAESTRYRVLTVFFEGVPVPGQEEILAYVPDGMVAETTPDDEGEPQRRLRIASAGEVRYHPPYSQFRCHACHAPDGGMVKRTPQEGLCGQCHDIPQSLRYAHGPVAVSDCLFCHHHHRGDFPKMLRYDTRTTCLRCHRQDDLTTGTHHVPDDTRTCTDCHNPHGGDNRFFLKSAQS